MQIPIFLNTIKAGFPSPADDFAENYLDLNEYLISHPVATFFVKVSGDSMINAGIQSGNILIVDRSLAHSNNSIVIAIIENEFTVKRFKLINGEPYLYPENHSYKPIKLKDQDEIWGVVTSVINKLI